jgi:hypothetical protein
MTFLGHVARAKSYGWWNSADPKPFLASSIFAGRRAVGKFCAGPACDNADYSGAPRAQ